MSTDVLVVNPGGNSLKAEVVRCHRNQQFAFAGAKLVSVSIEGIGKRPMLSEFVGKEKVRTEAIEASNYGNATESLLRWLEDQTRSGLSGLGRLQCAGIRVVHGGVNFTSPARITSSVEEEIRELEKLAPLHNKHSLETLAPIRRRLGEIPVYAVFDTAFHRTIPDHASLYAIPLHLARKHRIRRYGFHGISHRYLLARYAYLAGKPIGEIDLITTHLESGCSVTAIRRGQSVDNTMGLTPLEGLMMGTRSGDVDPSLLPFLTQAEDLSLDEVMTLLNQESGLLGISGVSLDTRILMKQYDTNPHVRFAMEMFSYRLLKAIGSYLAALGGADALIFGGGIGEDTPWVRERVCDALRFCGLEIDREANRSLIDREGLLSTQGSAFKAWVIPTEEGLQIAHECCHALAGASSGQT